MGTGRTSQRLGPDAARQSGKSETRIPKSEVNLSRRTLRNSSQPAINLDCCRDWFSESAAPSAKTVERSEDCEYDPRVRKIKDIEAAIVQLPREQFERLTEWFDRRRETEFDRQIQADAKSGRLGELHARLESANAGQPDEPLAEFLGRSKLPEG
jgi:hypothetical protein